MLAKERTKEAKRLSDYVNHFTEEVLFNAKLGKRMDDPTARS